jgi:putative membrane protein
MSVVAQIFVVIAGVFHVVVFAMESVLFRKPSTYRRFLVKDTEVETARPWAFNQGFYNLFLAAGPAAGLIAYHAGQVQVGRALVIYGCAFMAACGVVLFVSDRRLWRSMIGQSLPPLIAVIAALA